MRLQSLHEQSPVVLWTGRHFLQKPPKIAMNVSLLFSSMWVNSTPLSLREGLCGQPPHLYSGKLDFVTFCWLRAEVFSWKNCAARTLSEFLILRNICRNAEHRCLEYSGHSQGLGFCHYYFATKLYYMNGNAYHLLVLYVVTRLAHPALLTRPLLSALRLLELCSYHLCCIIRDTATQFKCCNELQHPVFCSGSSFLSTWNLVIGHRYIISL